VDAVAPNLGSDRSVARLISIGHRRACRAERYDGVASMWPRRWPAAHRACQWCISPSSACSRRKRRAGKGPIRRCRSL